MSKIVTIKEAIKYIIKEHISNYCLIIKLSFMNTEKQTIRTSLGIGWTYIHDFIYILVFILFRALIAGSGKIMGMNSIVYLVTGLIPWFFMNDVLNQGSTAIKANRGIVQSIRFPTVILPTIEVFSIFIKRLFSFVMLIFILFFFGYIKYFNFILFFYYILCMVCLMLSLNLILSAFVAISGDFQQLYLSFVRVIMYSLPILWSFEKVNNTMVNLSLSINPMVYVINGFRNALVLGQLQSPYYSLYFWISVAILFLLGSYVQFKLRKFYADFV